ncbi:hypothetical protein M758_UG012800 [Ceratodon purpureus]|nr:hypothetical protein M758_UG012800 [Ceratodon purpureus]
MMFAMYDGCVCAHVLCLTWIMNTLGVFMYPLPHRVLVQLVFSAFGIALVFVALWMFWLCVVYLSKVAGDLELLESTSEEHCRVYLGIRGKRWT